jgi:hypothetical protein
MVIYLENINNGMPTFKQVLEQYSIITTEEKINSYREMKANRNNPFIIYDWHRESAESSMIWLFVYAFEDVPALDLNANKYYTLCFLLNDRHNLIPIEKMDLRAENHTKILNYILKHGKELPEHRMEKNSPDERTEKDQLAAEKGIAALKDLSRKYKAT